jgi:hypothetical protein
MVTPLSGAEMRELADQLSGKMKGNVFVLITWTPGQSAGAYGNYISSGERPSMIAALRELADRLEGKMDAPTPETN